MAARATFALKAGEWFRRGRLLMVSPVHGDYRRYQAEIPLISLSQFPRPALAPTRLLLFQRAVDRCELVVEVTTKSVDHGDNRQRDTRRDQPIFNGGRASLVPPKTQSKILHC